MPEGLASGVSEGIKNDVVERRERNGRKAEANGDELMTSEVGPLGTGERWSVDVLLLLILFGA